MLLNLVCVVISHCVFNSHFPVSDEVSIFAYLRGLCFSRLMCSVYSKNFKMPEAFEVKIAKQISRRLEPVTLSTSVLHKSRLGCRNYQIDKWD